MVIMAIGTAGVTMSLNFVRFKVERKLQLYNSIKIVNLIQMNLYENWINDFGMNQMIEGETITIPLSVILENSRMEFIKDHFQGQPYHDEESNVRIELINNQYVYFVKLVAMDGHVYINGDVSLVNLTEDNVSLGEGIADIVEED